MKLHRKKSLLACDHLYHPVLYLAYPYQLHSIVHTLKKFFFYEGATHAKKMDNFINLILLQFITCGRNESQSNDGNNYVHRAFIMECRKLGVHKYIIMHVIQTT